MKLFSSQSNSKPSSALIGLLIGFAFGAYLSTLQAFSDKIYRSLDRFSKILYYVENDYVDPVNDKKLIEGAIRGMLETLDPHTVFLTPDVYRELKVDTVGKFGGVGIEVTFKGGTLTVVAPLEESPAARAGIQPGDKIVKIDGHSTRGMSLADSSKKMRGPRKSRVLVTIQRNGWKEPRDFWLTREIINIKNIKSELLEKQFAYLRITTFQERTREEFERELLHLKEKGFSIKGLIIDLRNNPGGLLEQAVELCDLFLKEGKIVSIKGRAQKNEEHRATGRAAYPDLPIVVLVNGGSASASEIVAGALQDTKRAYLIGTQTFGKGSVQTVIDLGENTGLKLTIARYYTPKDRMIDGKGIAPDEVVQPSSTKTDPKEKREKFDSALESQEMKNLPDLQKQAAVAYLKKQLEK